MSTQKKIQVAAVQMVSTPHPAENMQVAADAIREAAALGASFILLPEYWAILGQHDTDKLAHAEPLGDGPLQDFMASMARECAVWLVGGTIPLVSGEQGKVRNTLLAYNPKGQLAVHYDKIHLFGFSRDQETYDESRTILAGDDVAVLQADQLKVGLSICYDLRFPELYRAMGTCDLMVVPAAFTYTTGRAHWEILLRARAIENQCFVLAAAQGGKHVTGRRTWGHSMLVDPWGDILIQKSEGAGVVMGELDLAQSASIRASLPALSHRRL
jgi:predicted amidohydrolase